MERASFFLYIVAIQWFNGFAFLSAKTENEEPEQLDFGSGLNVVLGTGTSSDGRPLFFTVNHGIVTIAPNNVQQSEKSK